MNCKPGDMAFIVNTPMHQELRGRVVEVVRRAVPGEIVVMGGQKVHLRPDRCDSWIVRSQSSMPFTSSSGVLWTYERPIGDRYLCPIRPDETTEQSIEAMRLLTSSPNKQEQKA